MIEAERASRAEADGVPDRDERSEVLRVEGVVKRFGSNVVLDRLDLVLRENENLAILGKSGTGKSVLLKMIVGLEHPDEGEIYLWDQPVSRLSEEGWLPLRRRMGLVFQSGALFDSMTVAENIAFPLRERGITSAAEVQRIVEERLEWVGLEGTGARFPSELSGGMRRRVAVARTIAVDPEFVLYDEPTAGLDPVTGRRISQLMQNLDSQLGSTSIVVTHDIDCARRVAGRWAFLADGRVAGEGTPEELAASDVPSVREFLEADSRSESGTRLA